MTEDCKLFQRELPRTDAGDTFPSVLFLQPGDLFGNMLPGFFPGHFLHAPIFLSDFRQCVRLDSRLLLAQRQTLNTAETFIHGIAFGRQGSHDLPVLHVKIEITVNRTEIAG